MRTAWLFFLAYNLFDTVQIMGSSVMKGALKMGWGSIFNFLGYFVLGMPIAYYYAFNKGVGI